MDIMTPEQMQQKIIDLEARIASMPADVAGKFERALDETFSLAVADTVMKNGHIVAQALKPYAGEIVRDGLKQTAKAVVLAPVRWVRGVFGRKAEAATEEPAAAPDMGAAAAAPAV